MSNKPGTSAQSGEKIQRDIRQILANIRNGYGKKSTAPRPGGSSTARNEASTGKNAIVETPSSGNAGGGNDKQLLENSYARQLYFQHTNLTELIAKKLPKRSETTRRNYATQLYEQFLLQPDMRIRDPLHEVRFDTRYNEGLFCMARNIPLTTEQTLTQHRQKNAAAGIRQLCFVDMTKNNIVLDYQEKVVRKLKGNFRNWSSKLKKLPAYIMMYHRASEATQRKHLGLLQNSSTLKGSWHLIDSFVRQILVHELSLPCEKRTNHLWFSLRFDDDKLNRMHRLGNYGSHSHLDPDCDPPSLLDYSALSETFDITSDEEQLDVRSNASLERCNTPPNVARVDEPMEQADDVPEPMECQDLSDECNPEQQAADSSTDPAPVDPADVEVIVINDSPPGSPEPAITIKDELYTLDYMKSHTNICEVVANKWKTRKSTLNDSLSASKLEQYVERYYQLHVRSLPTNTLPQTLRLLTGLERDQLRKKDPIAWTIEKAGTQTTVPASVSCSIVVPATTPDLASVPVLTPAPAPSPTPVPGSVPAPNPTPVPISDPALTVAPAPSPTHAPVSVPALTAVPAPSPTPVPGSVPAPNPTPVPISDPALTVAPAPSPTHASVSVPALTATPASIPIPDRELTPSSVEPNPVLASTAAVTLLPVETVIPTSNVRNVTVRRARIEYDPDSSSSSPKDDISHAPSSISNAPLQLQPNTGSQNATLSQNFLPPASSTQDQPTAVYAYQLETVPFQEGHSQTQDPLRLSGTEQTIPCFQLVNPWNDTESTPLALQHSVIAVKHEHSPWFPGSIQLDSSGYEGYVEIVDEGSEQVIEIEDSPELEWEAIFTDNDNSSQLGTINARVAALLQRPSKSGTETNTAIECAEFEECDLPCTEVSSPLDGRTNRVMKQERKPKINRPLSGAFVTLESKKIRARLKPSLMSFCLATSAIDYNQQDPGQPTSTPMIFVTKIDVQSIRYTSDSIIWSHCGIVQHNKLTVNLKPQYPGIFSVSVHDQHAVSLFGVHPADRGGAALLAALEHMQRFRYGRTEPAREYYRRSMTEKVLQLFFETCPAWPQNGGLVMLFVSKSSHPANYDEVRFERFNYYLHSKCSNRPSTAVDGTDGCLSRSLMPGIAEKMRKWRKKLKSELE